ncbi:MAG: hypothetical protein KDI36_08090 [Pseudomonadales bacterium]|nr:hypothetical protein [Pseudomonadales bacterium]
MSTACLIEWGKGENARAANYAEKPGKLNLDFCREIIIRGRQQGEADRRSSEPVLRQ